MKVNKNDTKGLRCEYLQMVTRGSATGVCHDRIDLRDSVDDEEANPDGAWRMLVACPWKPLQCFSHVRNRDQEDHGALAAGGQQAQHRSNLQPGSKLVQGAIAASDGRGGDDEGDQRASMELVYAG